MPSLRVVNLTKRFGSISALEDVNLDIHDKEYVSIIGPSGCGKSTLIKCIAGIIDPDGGEVLVDGKPMRHVPIQRRRIGYVFQELTLFPQMRIIENVSYGPRVQGQKPQDSRALVTELLNLIKLADRSDSFPSELSGGAQQKVAVSRALASGSTLLLFDEPFGALDAKVRTELRYEIKKMTTDLGLTVFHVTHDQEEAMSISDRLVIMKKGRIVEHGSPVELYMHPKMIFTANFLGEANFLEGKVIEQQPTGAVVQTGNVHLQTSDTTRRVSEEVIIAARPEFMSIVRGCERENCLTGRVVSIRFMGNMIRYEVETSATKIMLVEHPICFGELDIQVHDEVTLTIPPHHVMTYSVPEMGLEKELQLE
jgi:ABC-type Fe3+/spermidine/putrescine transport system ATPase subunit